MSEPVTATAEQMYRDVQEKAPHLRAAIAFARECAIAYLAAKRAYEDAYDTAYLAAEGSIPERQAKARLATSEQRAAHDEALEKKRFAKLDADAWEAIFRAFEEVSRLARQELRSLA